MLYYDPASFRRSSTVEQATVNRLVVGSNPTGGANKLLSTVLNFNPKIWFNPG
jgi:hypothetical protein